MTEPRTTIAQIFTAELQYQRIPPEQATGLVRNPAMRGEGFVTIESARMLVAKALAGAAEGLRPMDSESILWAAHEIAPGEVPAPPPA